jgi:hypothetical protein
MVDQLVNLLAGYLGDDEPSIRPLGRGGCGASPPPMQFSPMLAKTCALPTHPAHWVH